MSSQSVVEHASLGGDRTSVGSLDVPDRNLNALGRLLTPLAAALDLAVTTSSPLRSAPQPRSNAIHQRRQLLAPPRRYFRPEHLVELVEPGSFDTPSQFYPRESPMLSCTRP